jgi:hypothetical protein
VVWILLGVSFGGQESITPCGGIKLSLLSNNTHPTDAAVAAANRALFLGKKKSMLLFGWVNRRWVGCTAHPPATQPQIFYPSNGGIGAAGLFLMAIRNIHTRVLKEESFRGWSHET